MNTSLPFVSAGTYLNAEWRDTRNPWTPTRPPGSFVTVSREAGSGGSSFARLLVRKLNAESPPDVVWSLFEDNLTPMMLKTHHLPTRIARFLPEERSSPIHSSIGELVGLHPSLWDLVEKTKDTMRQLAKRGHVILVGRGASFATADIPHGVHVRLVAPAGHRAKYLSRLYNISEDEALVHNAKCDRERRGYVKAHFDGDDRDPDAYDLIINTARLSLLAAAELVAGHVRAQVPAGA